MGLLPRLPWHSGRADVPEEAPQGGYILPSPHPTDVAEGITTGKPMPSGPTQVHRHTPTCQPTSLTDWHMSVYATHLGSGPTCMHPTAGMDVCKHGGPHAHPNASNIDIPIVLHSLDGAVGQGQLLVNVGDGFCDGCVGMCGPEGSITEHCTGGLNIGS